MIIMHLYVLLAQSVERPPTVLRSWHHVIGPWLDPRDRQIDSASRVGKLGSSQLTIGDRCGRLRSNRARICPYRLLFVKNFEV
jgi:hypothetical protein